jgi:hypothetical protein
MGLHSSHYDAGVTALCERTLVTVLGNAGWWGQHLYLVGGLVPRYITVAPAQEKRSHAGTRDVDLGLALAFPVETNADYEKLAQCLRRSGFDQTGGEPAFRWTHSELPVQIDLLSEAGEAGEVEPGQSFKPRSNTGSKLQALNVKGIHLLPQDHRVVQVTAERLDGQGVSSVDVCVAGPLLFAALKINAFQLRHVPKDAYDLVFTLGNLGPAGDPTPAEAGQIMAASLVAGEPFIVEAVEMIRSRFAEADLDGPGAYATFLSTAPEEMARLRNEAVAVVREALASFDAARAE